MPSVKIKKNSIPRIVTIACLLLFLLTKFVFRQKPIESAAIQFLLGVLPNFTASLGISSSFLLTFENSQQSEVKSYDKLVLFLILFIGLLLTVEEFYQVIARSTVLDEWDILFSYLGLLLFYIEYRLISK